MIEYSAISRRAIARLYRPYNDIDIFVEDRTYIGVYEKLINKALKGKAKVSKIIPLGPKSAVLHQAANDLETGGRPRLYLVDGDLDLLAFQRQPSYPHLHRLNVYSIENLLFENKAIESFCSFASPNMARGLCFDFVNLQELIRELNELVPYIVLLAIARRLSLSDNILAINPPSVTRSINGKHIGYDKVKLSCRQKTIISFIIKTVGLLKYRHAKLAVKANIIKRNISDHRIIPGKLFGMMYLNERISAAGGVGLPQKMVVSYLAEHTNLELDKRLGSRLRKLAKS